jgi:hypothetical protein
MATLREGLEDVKPQSSNRDPSNKKLSSAHKKEMNNHTMYRQMPTTTIPSINKQSKLTTP